MKRINSWKIVETFWNCNFLVPNSIHFNFLLKYYNTHSNYIFNPLDYTQKFKLFEISIIFFKKINILKIIEILKDLLKKIQMKYNLELNSISDEIKIDFNFKEVNFAKILKIYGNISKFNFWRNIWTFHLFNFISRIERIQSIFNVKM